MTNWPQINIDGEKATSMCFACGQENPIGLKLHFRWNGRTAAAEFTPSELHQGWWEIVHGGIIACLIDEATSYATLFEKLTTVTAKMEVRILTPVKINQPLLVEGTVTKKNRKLANTRAKISLRDGTVVAEGTATHFVVNERETTP
jgi:acyl-coenzyme A thioesterase PaaI-like protein